MCKDCLFFVRNVDNGLGKEKGTEDEKIIYVEPGRVRRNNLKLVRPKYKENAKTVMLVLYM